MMTKQSRLHLDAAIKNRYAVRPHLRTKKMVKPKAKAEWRVTPKLIARQERGLPLQKGERDLLVRLGYIKA